MGKKANNSDLGRAITRKQEKKAENRAKWNTPAAQIAAAVGRHTTPDDPSAGNLASILDATDLEELMFNATLANQSFTADRYPAPLAAQSVVVVTPLTGPASSAAATPSAADSAQDRRVRQQLDDSTLRIPRRPVWRTGTTYAQLMNAEMDAFLRWRRNIAAIESEYNLAPVSSLATTITPFEKNVEVWRQLWRVVERADIVLQIVDARNPLLYFCADLVRYVSDEMQRAHMVVMNKSDLLTPDMISRWQRYFADRHIDVVFFSAFKESVGENVNDERVLNATQLVDRLEKVERCAPVSRNDSRVVVGLCGYPNVGKSSTINVLIESVAEDLPPPMTDTSPVVHDDDDDDQTNSAQVDEHTSSTPDETTTQSEQADAGTAASKDPKPTVVKRVAVSATPGKTKHFQTLVLTDSVMLCDCPGLVFPNFSSSKAELICAGVLSIDTMRGDFVTPVSLLAARVPAAIFEGVYGLRFPPGSAVAGAAGKRYVTGDVLLDTHARARGYMTDHGRADASRSARVLLKDFVSGRVVYAHAPQGAGESGVGASVFAKKGKLVHERTEAAAQGPLSLSSRPAAPGETSSSVGGGEVRAMVSASRKGRGKEFIRVERSFY